MKKNDPAPETAPQPSAPEKPETHTVEPKSGGSVVIQPKKQGE